MGNERTAISHSAKSQFVNILDTKMHYLEMGQGDPILFLHGIPMSSYLWRNVMPHMAKLGRCIAVDLIGFGESGRPNIEYSIFDHVRYIEAFITKLALHDITFVLHGWGSLIGFHYAMEQEKNCKGLVFYESFLRPCDSSLPFSEQFFDIDNELTMIDPKVGDPDFVQKFIAQQTLHALSDEEIQQYCRPFLQNTSKPIERYLAEIPKGDGRSQIDMFIAHYSEKLTQSYLPKLLMYSMPGFVTTIATVMWAKENLPNLEIADIGEELHLAPETCSNLMGETMSIWLQGVEQYR